MKIITFLESYLKGESLFEFGRPFWRLFYEIFEAATGILFKFSSKDPRVGSGSELEVMADLDREVFICSYKKFWSRIGAVIGASGDLIK